MEDATPDPPEPPPSQRLLDQVRHRIRVKHYALRTEQVYVGWVKRCVHFHNRRHPRDLGAADVEAFLSHLAVQRNVSASTQNQAKAALLFLYKEVLGITLPWLDEIVQARVSRRLPVVLTTREVKRLLDELDGTMWLVAALLYGTGMRLLEGLRLRAKDLDFERRAIERGNHDDLHARAERRRSRRAQPARCAVTRRRASHDDDDAAVPPTLPCAPFLSPPPSPPASTHTVVALSHARRRRARRHRGPARPRRADRPRLAVRRVRGLTARRGVDDRCGHRAGGVGRGLGADVARGRRRTARSGRTCESTAGLSRAPIRVAIGLSPLEGPTLRLVTIIAAVVFIGIAFAGEARSAEGRLYDVDGSKMWVESEGDGPPVVFLHGGLQSFASSFDEQRAAFAKNRRVIGIDQVGHGHSPDEGKPFSYQRMADQTAALLRQLALGPVDLVGESDGGDVALLIAHDHPALVRRVAVSGANLRAGLPPDELERRSHWTDGQVDEKVQQLQARLPPRFRTNFEAAAPDGPARWNAHVAKSYRLWLTPVVIEPSALKTIAAPVLVIAGDHDFTSLEETTELWRGLPHGQLMIVPGTGHGTFHDRPALMNLAIREFLDAP